MQFVKPLSQQFYISTVHVLLRLSDLSEPVLLVRLCSGGNWFIALIAVILAVYTINVLSIVLGHYFKFH